MIELIVCTIQYFSPEVRSQIFCLQNTSIHFDQHMILSFYDTILLRRVRNRTLPVNTKLNQLFFKRSIYILTTIVESQAHYGSTTLLFRKGSKILEIFEYKVLVFYKINPCKEIKIFNESQNILCTYQ
jgi:hypothetical protein